MGKLINDLLSYSRVGAGGPSFVSVDLGEVAGEAASDLEARLEEVSGRVEIGGLHTIEADPTQMRQLLENLIGNGLKFRRKDQAPVVRVQSKSLDRDGRDGADSSQNGLCRLTVADNGVGFDEKYLD